MFDEKFEVAAPGQDAVCQQLDVMIKMVMDLSSQVKATEDQQGQAGESPMVSLSTSCPVRRATNHVSPVQEIDVSEEVSCSSAKRMKQMHVFTKAMTKDHSTSE